MSDCCSSSLSGSCNESPKVAKKLPCPQCNKKGTLLSISTIYHHLKQPWAWKGKRDYYFCDNSDWAVAYFDDGKNLINASELRTTIGVKTQQADDLICYCYGVSLQAARENPHIKSFVVEMTKHGSCACETRNPSGRCCLKDFPK